MRITRVPLPGTVCWCGIAKGWVCIHLPLRHAPHCWALRSCPLPAGQGFGWGCLRGLHTDRGSPHLTLRLGLEKQLGRRLMHTWELRHRAMLGSPIQLRISWKPTAKA